MPDGKLALEPAVTFFSLMGILLASGLPLRCGGAGPRAGVAATNEGACGSCGAARVQSCGELALSEALRRGPAAPGQEYLRCGTLGPEHGWRVSLSPDGSRLAARTSAGTVRLLATDGEWREIAQLASPLGRIDAVAFSPDCTLLAALSAEMGQVTLWRTHDGAFVRAFAVPPASTIDGWASALAFSSDGQRLATSLGTFTGESADPGGTVIDLASGVIVDWRTGLPASFALVMNPENLQLGAAVPLLRFMIGDRLLFMDTEYQIGNSPPSTRLSLRDPSTGREIVLFDMYSRALSGFALSNDGRFVALARTNEALGPGGFPGVSVFRADTGQRVAGDTTLIARVLAFSPDGGHLHAQTPAGDGIVVLNTPDLRAVARFDWPAGALFLGVSPQGDLVGSGGGATTWRDSSSGAVLRAVDYALADATFSADGRYGAGAGDAALFHAWRELDGGELCAPLPRGAAAPPLSSLGEAIPGSAGEIVSADGSTRALDTFVVHTHATNWSATHVVDSASGTERRVFGATAALRRPLAVAPNGERLFTPEGPVDVAVWCRSP